MAYDDGWVRPHVAAHGNLILFWETLRLWVWFARLLFCATWNSAWQFRLLCRDWFRRLGWTQQLLWHAVAVSCLFQQTGSATRTGPSLPSSDRHWSTLFWKIYPFYPTMRFLSWEVLGFCRVEPTSDLVCWKVDNRQSSNFSFSRPWQTKPIYRVSCHIRAHVFIFFCKSCVLLLFFVLHSFLIWTAPDRFGVA